MKNQFLFILAAVTLALGTWACCDPDGANGGGPLFCPQDWVEVDGECQCPEDYGRVYFEDIDDCFKMLPSQYYSDNTIICPCITNYNFGIQRENASSIGMNVYTESGTTGGQYHTIPAGNPTEPLPDDSLSMRILAQGLKPKFMDFDADNCFKDHESELNHIDLTGKYHDRYLVLYLEYVFKNWDREYCQDTLWRLPR